METTKTITSGPYGGTAGKSWDDGTYSDIRKIIIYSGDEIDSIQVFYDNGGTQVTGNKHGGNNGNPTTVTLNYPSEYLVSISGYYGLTNFGAMVVRSLTLTSNVRQYGPYGKKVGTPFQSTPSNGEKIIGFFGREGLRVDAVGVYTKAMPTPIVTIGPFGSYGGQLWDDKTYNTVRELKIYAGAVIDSIQVVYEDTNGNQVPGTKHGGGGGGLNTVILDSDEYLVSFWGYHGQVGSLVAIRSLGFQSNKRKYGPYGVEDGQKFDFSSSNGGKIIGFHGAVSNDYLIAIGAYLDK